MKSAVILLVEDDHLLRDVLDETLHEAGFELLIASNGAEAIKLLERHNGDLRGLVSDVNLGIGLDGWEVARRARELTASLPVVYMSGASTHEWTSHGVPGSILIAKPFAPAQVITAISTLMNASDTQLQ